MYKFPCEAFSQTNPMTRKFYEFFDILIDEEDLKTVAFAEWEIYGNKGWAHRPPKTFGSFENLPEAAIDEYDVCMENGGGIGEWDLVFCLKVDGSAVIELDSQCLQFPEGTFRDLLQSVR